MPTLKLQALPILLSLLPLATAAPSPALAPTPPPTNDWAGTGQIRPVNSDSTHEVLGCLTNLGQWTTDESKCGVFTGVREEANSIRLSSATGVCGLEGVAKFSCGQGVEQRVWGVRYVFVSFLQASVRMRRCADRIRLVGRLLETRVRFAGRKCCGLGNTASSLCGTRRDRLRRATRRWTSRFIPGRSQALGMC